MTIKRPPHLYRLALGDILREERHSQALSLRTVASQAAMALGYLSEIERGQKEISSELLQVLVVNGLGAEVHEIIIRAALRMAGLDVPDTAESLLNRIDEYADLR